MPTPLSPDHDRIPPAPPWNRRVLLVGFILFVVTMAVYWPVRQADFINYDDPGYVTKNIHVLNGLTLTDLWWDLTTFYRSNWHPLTWLSLQIDQARCGLRTSGYHLTNMLLHALSTALLFAVWYTITGALGRSAMVAGLFALHPLHVESVAWVAERKDVLSGLFWMLTLAAYIWYVHAPGFGRYLLVCGLFALGLAAKPMLVTLPCVLLLLDYWPLGRWSGKTRSLAWNQRPSTPAATLLWEKVPLFVLAALSSIVTIWASARGGAIHTLADVPLADRLANTACAYATYLAKTIWPENLAIFYPYEPLSRVSTPVAGAFILLAGLTLVALLQRKHRPYLLIGWLWYVGALVPVIGLLQVGDQAFADRYTYLPLIGIFVALVWGAAEVARGLRIPRPVIRAAGFAVLAACTFATRRQLVYWQDSVALWTHAIQVTSPNPTAEWLLGSALVQAHQPEEGVAHLEHALALDPRQADAHYNLGLFRELQGRTDEASRHYQEALASRPYLWQARVRLGLLDWHCGNYAGAQRQLEEAARADPLASQAHTWLGKLLTEQGELGEAARHYAEAYHLESASARAANDLGTALSRLGKPDEAIRLYSQAIKLNPSDAAAYANMGVDLARLGRLAEARVACETSVALAPDQVSYRCSLAVILHDLGDTAAARAQYAQASRRNPDWMRSANQEARMLATHPDVRRRNGSDALFLARQVCQATDERNWVFLDTLAAAYAEVGQFEQAMETERKALRLASGGRAQARPDLENRLHLYQNRQPFRDPALR